MSFAHRATRSELFVDFHDQVTHRDIVDCCVEMAADPCCRESRHALIDFQERSCCLCAVPDLALVASVATQLLQGGPSRSHVCFVVPCGDGCPRLSALRDVGRMELIASRAQARERIAALPLAE